MVLISSSSRVVRTIHPNGRIAKKCLRRTLWCSPISAGMMGQQVGKHEQKHRHDHEDESDRKWIACRPRSETLAHGLSTWSAGLELRQSGFDLRSRQVAQDQVGVVTVEQPVIEGDRALNHVAWSV